MSEVWVVVQKRGTHPDEVAICESREEAEVEYAELNSLEEWPDSTYLCQVVKGPVT